MGDYISVAHPKLWLQGVLMHSSSATLACCLCGAVVWTSSLAAALDTLLLNKPFVDVNIRACESSRALPHFLDASAVVQSRVTLSLVIDVSTPRQPPAPIRTHIRAIPWKRQAADASAVCECSKLVVALPSRCLYARLIWGSNGKCTFWLQPTMNNLHCSLLHPRHCRRVRTS